VGGGAVGRAQAAADDAEDDGQHPEMLAPARALVEQALADEQQHEQPTGQRRLDDDERREQQRDDLERKPGNRQRGAGQPASAHDQLPGEGHAEVVARRHLTGVQRLERDP